MIMTFFFKGSRFYRGVASVETAAKQRGAAAEQGIVGLVGKENGRNNFYFSKNVSGTTMPCGHFYMIMIILSE